MRTDKAIVNQTNDLARLLARAQGWEAPEGFKFYEHRSPMTRRFWKLACIAQEMLTNTDPNNALAEVEK